MIIKPINYKRSSLVLSRKLINKIALICPGDISKLIKIKMM